MKIPFCNRLPSPKFRKIHRGAACGGGWGAAGARLDSITRRAAQMDAAQLFVLHDNDSERVLASLLDTLCLGKQHDEIRSPQHVIEAAKMGADVSTVPPDVLWQLFKHPLTDAGLKAFLADWAETGQSILGQ